MPHLCSRNRLTVPKTEILRGRPLAFKALHDSIMVIIAIKVPVRPMPAEQCTRICFYFYRNLRLRSTRESNVGKYSGVTTLLSSHANMFSCSTYFSVSPSEIQMTRLIRPGSGKISSVKRMTFIESSSFILFVCSLQ